MQTLKLTKKYDKYPEYKDSGVEWLGQIPKDWKVVSSRQLFTTAKERVGTSFADHKILSLTLQGVVPRVLDGSGKNPAEYDTYQKFKKDDLVFCLFDYDVTPRTIGYVEEDGMMTGAYTRLIPRSDTYSKYFYYYFLSLDFNKELLHLCTGLRNSLSKPVFWSMKSSLPSILVQEKITKYLDEKISSIDQIIQKKQKLIELLSEKRTAVINNTVTKGLNSKAELVESGIELIGKTPKGWKVKKVRSILKEHRQGFYTSDSYSDDGVKLLRITDFNEFAEIVTDHCPKVSFTNGIKDFLLKRGDFVFARTGGAGTFGYVDFDEPNLAYASYLIRFRFNPDTNTDFLKWYFFSDVFQKGVQSRIHGGVNQNVHAEDIKEQRIPMPSVEEQEKISELLSVEVGLYRSAISQVEGSIQLLQEFKSSLISNVVTGKIKL